MSQSKKAQPKAKTINPEDLQKKKLQALKEREKQKEMKNYERLEDSFKPLKEKEEFDRFFVAKEKLYDTREEREKTRTAILNMKADFDDMKTRLKGFIQEQVVSSAKLAVPRTQNKAKTITQ